MKTIYVAIGIDCDPDRDTYPDLTFRGIDNIPKLFEIPDVKWTFNIRADSQSSICPKKYRYLWGIAVAHGCELAWHLHYYDGVDVSIAAAQAVNWTPQTVHMGWTFQNEYSIKRLYEIGVRNDYSPLPGLANGDEFNWLDWPMRPKLWHGVRMIPAYTFPNRILSRRFEGNRVMLTTCTHPFLYHQLIKSWFASGLDFFVSYFHVDEIISALPDWRKHLYSFPYLVSNIRYFKKMAEQNDCEIKWVTINQLAEVLFDENNSCSRG